MRPPARTRTSAAALLLGVLLLGAAPEVPEPTADPTPTPAPTPPPSATSSPSDPPTTAPPTPAAPTIGTPTPLPSATATATATATPAPTPSTTPSSTPSASASPDAGDLVPTLELGSVTIGPPAAVQPAADDELVTITVLDIPITDTRTTPAPYTASAAASGVTGEGGPVAIPGMSWRTTAITDEAGIPVAGVTLGQGDLLESVVIASGGGSPGTVLVDGVITVPVTNLPPGDYTFTLATSIS